MLLYVLDIMAGPGWSIGGVVLAWARVRSFSALFGESRPREEKDPRDEWLALMFRCTGMGLNFKGSGIVVLGVTGLKMGRVVARNF